MAKKMIPLLIGFLCGNLFIKLFPIVVPFELSELLLIFVLNPFEFLVAATVFMIGFLMNAVIMEEGIEQITLLLFRKKAEIYKIFLFLLLLISFSLLFITGFWQTMVLFCFSLLYGIISIDFKRIMIIED